MTQPSEADRYLLDQIAHGNTGAWSQLVTRYHGRLLAFARSRASTAADAEDLVQETFLLFLQSFRAFRADASLETYLFTILRRRMIDHFRCRRIAACDISETGQLPLDTGHTPSWYVRRDEQVDALRDAVMGGLDHLIRRLHEQKNLDELKAIELLFYAQMRNKETAKLCGLDEKQVAMLKFRALAQIREHVSTHLPSQSALEHLDANEGDRPESILTEAWERMRPTCPKRSTLGRLVLGTLDSPWREYVEFHVNQLGCRFCQANLADLRRESDQSPAEIRRQVFQSTVGFLTRH